MALFRVGSSGAFYVQYICLKHLKYLVVIFFVVVSLLSFRFFRFSLYFVDTICSGNELTPKVDLESQVLRDEEIINAICV